MLASGGAELVTLGSAIPFLAVLSDPDKLWQQPLGKALAARIGATLATHFLLLATVAFAAAAGLAAGIRLVSLWLNGNLAAAVGSDLSIEAFRRTLYQPYEVHLQRNSATVIVATTSQVNDTVLSINALLQLITSAVVATSLFTGLLFINTRVAVAASGMFVSAYLFLSISTRRELSSNSKRISKMQTLQLKTLQEALGAVRDILLEGSQATYLQTYQKADRLQRQLAAKNIFLTTFPRYALEALGIVLIAFLGGVFALQQGSGANVIPLLGVLALGAQRLLPALQQIYIGWASLKSCNASIQAVLGMLNQPLPAQLHVTEALHLQESIQLEGVNFRYGHDKEEVLSGLNLLIRRGERIGLIGTSGSGKSTTVDLLMGLLVPTSGRLLIDGVDLNDPEYVEQLTAWRATIAHVPQRVYLADKSIAENIAFGVQSKDIDISKVRIAAVHAQVASFIETCPHGYDTLVGEQGISLSGGQRQRIGVARALYKQAQVIVFDEATSALDRDTEEALMLAVDGLSKDLTIILIAHRLSTLQLCDRIIRLEKGNIVYDGPSNVVLP